MRIVSLNTGGGRVSPGLVEWIGRCGADLFCLQEVIRAGEPSPATLHYVDGDLVLPQQADLHGEIAAALPGHDGMFLPSARGRLHDPAGRGHVSLFGLSTFWPRAMPVIRQEAAFIHGAFSPDGWGDHPRPRNAHAVTLHRQGASPLTVLHLHGLRDPAGKHDTPARAAQLARIRAMAGDALRRGESLVLCGDFNVLPQSATLEALRADGLRDLVAEFGVTDTRTSLYPKPGRHANYAFASPDLDIRSFEAPASPEVSDHRPLIIEIGRP